MKRRPILLGGMDKAWCGGSEPGEGTGASGRGQSTHFAKLVREQVWGSCATALMAKGAACIWRGRSWTWRLERRIRASNN